MAERHTYYLPSLSRVIRRGWQPAIDVYHCNEGWLVKCDLAGVQLDDIQIETQGQLLTILGSRRDWAIGGEFRAYTLEITYSHFRRSVELPCDLDAAEISSEYRDGMLLVSISTQPIGEPDD
jgi:HSP20 family protein